MKYYLLKTLDTNMSSWPTAEEMAVCVLRSHPEGMGLKTWKLNKGAELLEGEYPQDAQIFMSDEEPGTILCDLIPNTEHMLILSRQLKEGMEAINRGSVQYLPVSIYNHQKQLASSDYFIVNPIGTFDVLDTDASEIEYFEEQVLKIRKHVLDPKKVMNIPDVFRIKENPETYVVSERILDEWRKITPKPTGIRFWILDDPTV